MKLYLKLIQFWVLMAVLGASARAEEGGPPLFYPFTVKIGEQEAEMKARNDLSAVIAKQVKADTVLKITKKSDLLTADPKGKIQSSKLGGILNYLKGNS